MRTETHFLIPSFVLLELKVFWSATLEFKYEIFDKYDGKRKTVSNDDLMGWDLFPI